MRARLLGSLVLLGTAAACSHAAGSHDASAAGSHDASAAGDGGDGGPEIVCPVSDSGRFEETPTGACTGAGSCAIELDNSCRPGLAAVPATPPVFECRCVANQWECVVMSGGLGLITCGDAGGPD